MLTTDPLLLSGSCFMLGFLLGIVLFRGDFCMVAMLRDFFLVRHTVLLKSFVLYFLVASALFHFGSLTGILPISPPLTLRPASLTTIAGGFVFGIGMVLAGGCVVSTLYKMASGNLANWIAFGGILAGSLLYAEIHPLVKNLTKRTGITESVTIAQHEPALLGVTLTVVFIGGVLTVNQWRQRGGLQVIAYAEGYLQPWKVVLWLAAVNFVYYALSGAPMGVTTAYAKMAGYLENLLWPHHVASLTYFMEDSIHWQWGQVMISGGAGPRIDYIGYTEGALVIGVFLGALAAALYYREFKIYGLPPWRQCAAALTGGMLLALGARIAAGCNVKFFLGGLPLLAWQGIFFALATTAGCYVGTKILTRYVITR